MRVGQAKQALGCADEPKALVDSAVKAMTTRSEMSSDSAPPKSVTWEFEVMSKRAIRLCEKHSSEELEEMLHKICQDPQSKVGATGINVYSKKAMTLMDDITWAMYWKRSPKGNQSIARQTASVKFW
jgi:hypothetical protein